MSAIETFKSFVVLCIVIGFILLMIYLYNNFKSILNLIPGLGFLTGNKKAREYITANCPKGTTNTGLSCLGSFGRGTGRDDVFYDGWEKCATEDGGGDRNNCEKNGARVYPKCSYLAKQKEYENPDNWTNDACCMCSPSIRDISKVGTCSDPNYKKLIGGMCYKDCEKGFEPDVTGLFCDKI
jgi:hypothetical protein